MNNLADIGLKIGHAQNETALTGCTVILCEGGAVGGIDRRGGGTSTRQADGFEPWHVVPYVHGVLLTGGSAFGLGASSGVLRYLEEREIGFGMGVNRVPIVGAAALFDLNVGDGRVRPDPEMAYRACLQAGGELPATGCVGAGTGATVGKVLGIGQAMKSGLGLAVETFAGGLVVGAITAVNASGDVVDPATGRIVAGVRAPDGAGGYFANAMDVLHGRALEPFPPPPPAPENTVIGVVFTNARLTKTEATKMAQMGHDGLAQAVRPAHMMFDGDTVFALATGQIVANPLVVSAFATAVFARAVVQAVKSARSLGGLPAYADVPAPYRAS